MYSFQINTSLDFRVDSIESISEYIEDAEKIIFLDPQTVTFECNWNVEYLIITMMQSQLISHIWNLDVTQTGLHEIEERSYGGEPLLISNEAPQVIASSTLKYPTTDDDG